MWKFKKIYAIDEEPEQVLEQKDFKFLSWGMKYLSFEFEKFLKERGLTKCETVEWVYDDKIILGVEAHSYYWYYFSLTKV
jgi:hypothetical protein